MAYYRDWTKGMVHVGFAERLYRLPPRDPPQILSKNESPTYHTLAVGWHTTDYSKIASTFSAWGGVYDSTANMWLFQESEHAPAPSNHPPPENDDDPKLRPLHRTFNVPKTVPVGTHDKVLFFLGGLQRCDLPTYCRPMLLDVEEDENENATTPPPCPEKAEDPKGPAAAASERRRKARRTEEDSSTPYTANDTFRYSFSRFSSRHPLIPCVESRVFKGAAKGLSADILRQLLTHRSATAVTGSKSSQALSLVRMGQRDAYHTIAYRKYVYSIVSSGEMKLVAPRAEEGEIDTIEVIEGNLLSVEEAKKSLPWNEHGEITSMP